MVKNIVVLQKPVILESGRHMFLTLRTETSCTPMRSSREVSMLLILQRKRPYIGLHQSDNREVVEQLQANIQLLRQALKTLWGSDLYQQGDHAFYHCLVWTDSLMHVMSNNLRNRSWTIQTEVLFLLFPLILLLLPELFSPRNQHLTDNHGNTLLVHLLRILAVPSCIKYRYILAACLQHISCRQLWT